MRELTCAYLPASSKRKKKTEENETRLMRKSFGTVRNGFLVKIANEFATTSRQSLTRDDLAVGKYE